MSDPVWESGKKSRQRREARWERQEQRPWSIDYDLAYDGGGSGFTMHYRTQFGARVAAFCHLHLLSYGGSAKLSRTLL